MEPQIRGSIEKLLDDYLTTDQLTAFLLVLKEIQPSVNSIEDAIFGYIIGATQGAFVAMYHQKHNRTPDESERAVFLTILGRRAAEIKSKTREIDNQ